MSYFGDVASLIGTIIATISAIIAAIGLWLTKKALEQNTKTRELQLLDSAFKEIKSVEIKLYDNYKNSDEKTKKEWDSLLFNSIEYFSMLVNNKYISDKKMIHFFDEAIVEWYEQIFVKRHTQDEKQDPKVYPEMKMLYHRIKLKRITST